ncbi:MAG: hypothetical protein GY950_03955 [bacterium]|nr:hypothetical protein [bacterium]
MKFQVLLLILFLFFVNAVPRLHASEPLPFNEPLKKLIAETFYKDGAQSLEKIERYQAGIKARYDEVKQNLKNYYTLEKGNSKKKSKKKIKKKNDIKAYKILRDYIERLKHLDDPVEFQRTALKILRLDYALKINARKLASVELLEKIPFSLTGKKIPIRRAPKGEASNLVKPETGDFYSQDELRKIKRTGGDISELNPPADGTFWVDHAIPRVDVPTYYLTGQDPLHKGIEIVIPRKKAYFDEVRKTQSKPKLDLYYRHNGEKLECKLKVAAEVHSETTCAALYTTLGFSADITAFVKDYKVVLGDVTHHEFRLEWNSYYGSYKLDKYIKTKGSDEEGNYIIFHDGVLEIKPPGLIRAGPWAYGGNGNGGMREVRATLLFNMWVSNLDLKESENNKLVLRKIGEKYKFFHIQHDMGFAFGKTYMERPGSFLWNLVKKRTDKYIHMNFNCLVDNSLFDNVTFADGRWMVRLIARLTRRQIADAVVLGGWPEPLQKLLVEKLIARRNQLVKVFGLVGEKTPEGDTIAILKFDRYLTTADGAVKNGKLKVYNFAGYPQYFGPRVNEMIALVLKGLRNGAVDSMVNLAASLRYVVLQPEWFGLDRRFVSKIILRMDREIEQNPNPADVSESFLVKDTMQIGLRLGYGSVVFGDIAYSRKYTLVYPTATRDSGRFHNKFILNLFLPFKHKGRHLPRNHVVMLEDFLEGRGKLSLRSLGSMLEYSLTASKVYLSRRFISFKENQQGKRAVFFEDKSLYDELKFRIFFEFLNTFRSTPLYSHIQRGILHRDYIEMDVSDLETDPGKRKALELLLNEGDATLLEKVGRKKSIHDRFFEKKIHLKILGLIRRRSVYRVDHLQESFADSDQDHHYVQVESSKLKAWQFLDNGERHFSRIRLTGKAGEDKSVKEPLLTLSLQVNDRSTHDGELKHGYLFFINTLALDKDFIKFDSSRHTVNRLWGNTQTIMNVILYEEGIANLVNAGEAEIWAALAEVTGKPVDYWRGEAKPRYKRGRPVTRGYSPDKYLALKTRYFIRRLRKARRAGDSPAKAAHVVKAVRKAVYTSGQTFSPILPAVIHKLAGKGNVYLNARVAMPENKELIFPARAPLYNELGTDRQLKPPVFQFIFDDPSEIYHLF